MCTRPILIKNKKFASLCVKTPNAYIKVPCGQCDECLRKRAKDLYIRVRFEAEETIRNGGTGFMCTLTYDDTNVPKLEVEGKTFMVFNKRHVIKFLKRLRTRLDRYFKKMYDSSAPDFKYLVTSEYGTNPGATHRPHYHLIFLFAKPISLFIFDKCFHESLVDHKTGNSYFGKIYQCDLLDIKKGGIRYSAKYVLKDQTYSQQNYEIRKLIKFNTTFVCSKYGIEMFPNDSFELLNNRAIRSRKDYKRDLADMVGKYRDMLQFYMCSNDMGCSAVLNRYGENLLRLGQLDIDGYAYAIPKAVIQRLERTNGTAKRLEVTKTVFMSFFRSAVNAALEVNLIDTEFKKTILDFSTNYIQPLYGSYYFIHPAGFLYYSSLDNNVFRNYDDILEEYQFYDNNDFFFYRDMVVKIMNYYNRQENLDFRARLARKKSTEEKEKYIKKKRNQSYKY